MAGIQNATTFLGKKGKYKRYTQESLQLAYDSVMNKRISVRAASRLYGIPRVTLLDKVRGRTPVIARPGPEAVLTKAEEDKIVQWIQKMAKIGYGRTRRELKFTVKKIIDADGRENPFKDNLPGNTWVTLFMKRHPELSMRVPEALGRERACVTKEKIAKWFQECQEYMLETNQLEAFGDPARVFNADEIGFPLEGKLQLVLAPKGAKNVYQQTCSTKQQITVMGACNAAGVYVPPLIIFPGVRFSYDPLDGAPEHSCFAKTKSGWVNSEVFFEYLSNHFLPFVRSLKVKFPIVLYVDGHTSHISLESADFCAENDIILYCLPSHSSHLMQPLDVAVYKSVKSAWYQAVREYMIKHPGKVVGKSNFSRVFCSAWEATIIPSHAVSGFRKSGLVPFNPSAVDDDMLAPSEVYPRIITDEPTINNPQSPSAAQDEFDSSTLSAETVALNTFEAALGKETVSTFQCRVSEGYDIPDPMYDTWKKLQASVILGDMPGETKEKPSKPAARFKSIKYLGGPSTSSYYVSPTLEEHLKFPQRPVKAVKKKDRLPNVISGDVFRGIMREKLQKMEEKQKAKKLRKQNRAKAP